MWDVSINYWAVLAAGASAMVIGFVWYLPQLAGGPWMKALGKTKEDIEKDSQPIMFLWTFILALVTAYILNHFIQLVGVETMSDALAVAFWAWLGFVATVMAMNLMYERRTATFFWVNGAYQLITLAVMAVILFAWQ